MRHILDLHRRNSTIFFSSNRPFSALFHFATRWSWVHVILDALAYMSWCCYVFSFFSTTLWNASDFRSGWSCKFRNQRSSHLVALDKIWYCFVGYSFCFFFIRSVCWMDTSNVKWKRWTKQQLQRLEYNQVTMIGMHFVSDKGCAAIRVRWRVYSIDI